MAGTFFVKDKDKTQEWHKKMHDHFLSICSFGPAYEEMDLAERYAYGEIVPGPWSFLSAHASGSIVPVQEKTFTIIPDIIDQLKSEYLLRSRPPKVEAMSRSAVARKMDLKASMEADWALRDLYAEDEQETGIELPFKPKAKTEHEFKELISSVKEKGEIVYGRLMDDFLTRTRFKGVKSQLLEDVTTYGTSVIRVIQKGTHVETHRIDPKSFIFDPEAKDPWKRDASFVGTMEYMPVHRVAEMYGMSPEDLEEAFATSGTTGPLSLNTTLSIRAGATDVPLTPPSDGGNYILVTYIEWKDFKKKLGFEYKSGTGALHYHVRDEEIDPAMKKSGVDTERKRAKADRVDQANIEVVRHCCVVGKKIVSYGEIENQPRTHDDWWKTGYSIHAYMPRWNKRTTSSLVMRLGPLQDLRDHCMFAFRKAMQRDRGKFFVTDVSQKPDKFDIEDQMYYAEWLGTFPINSRSTGAPSGYNQFQGVDMTISPATRMYIEMFQIATAEIARLSGVTPERGGMPVGPNEAPGAMEIRRQQSQVKTEGLFDGLDMSISMALQHVISAHKQIIIQEPDSFEQAIGADGVRFITSNPEVEMDDYGISVAHDINIAERSAMIREMTSSATQSGQVQLVDAITVMLEDDPSQALALLKELVKQSREEQAAMQEQAMQMKAQEQAMEAARHRAATAGRIMEARIASEGAQSARKIGADADLMKAGIQAGAMRDSANMKRSVDEDRNALTAAGKAAEMSMRMREEKIDNSNKKE